MSAFFSAFFAFAPKLYAYSALLLLCLSLPFLQLAQGWVVDIWLARATMGDVNWVDLLLWQLVHTSWLHLVINLVGLLLLVAIQPESFRGIWWLVRVLACGWIGNLLFLLIDKLVVDDIFYVALGLSGALHAAAWLVAVESFRTIPGKTLMALLVSKLAYEQFFGVMPFSSSLQVLVDVHLYAVIGAVWVGVLTRALTPKRRL